MTLRRILVVLGLGVLFGFLEPGRFTYAFSHATLYVLLPILLYEAAWNLNLRSVRRLWPTIAALTAAGVVVTAAAVTAALIALHVPLAPALLTGAILSATDPVAVIAVFSRLRVPRTLATIVESESLFNDALAVVLYRVVLLVMAGTFNAGVAAFVSLETVAGVLGGTALGCAVAFVVARLFRRVAQGHYQIAATVVSAYGAYFVAERIHLSGIFATIACGMALRYFERAQVSPAIAADVDRFWDVGAVLANALLFFMVGAAVLVTHIADAPAFAFACVAAVIGSRVLVGALFSSLRWPHGWSNVVRVAGMRGGLCLALALALPPVTPYREPIVDAALAVCLATLVIASLALPPAVRRTGIRRV
jgi:CPA1 family monovalent cation:H+ antiporter